jgi:hypothetical protein
MYYQNSAHMYGSRMWVMIILSTSPTRQIRSDSSNYQAPHDDGDELEIDVDVLGSKPQSRRSDSRVPQVPVDAPGVSICQSRCSDSQGLDTKNNQKANGETLASKIAVDVPEPSKPQRQHSHSQVPHADDTQLANEDDNSLEMHVNTPALLTPKSSRFRSDIPLNLKRKMWDDVSRTTLV